MRTGTREEWLQARKALLEREKELTRQSDALAQERLALPWVPVENEYVFATNAGPRTLAELFDGCSQLIVYHFMHGPLTPDGCPGCTFHANQFDGAVVHLANHDVTFLCASRSPLETLNAYKQRMGWEFEWVSSGETSFNLDFGLFDGEGFNFGTPSGADVDIVGSDEMMGLSCFALADGVVHHTYSCYDRGTDVLNLTWQLLDRAPKGRDGGDVVDGWPRRHPEYAS